MASTPDILDIDAVTTGGQDITIVDPELTLHHVHTKQPKAVPAQPVVSHESHAPARERMRLLCITYEDVFNANVHAAQRYTGYGALYEEVHIIVPTRTEYAYDVMQLADNVWAYPTHSTKWWMYPYDVYQTAKQQLFFGGLFRPDVILATDPFELGGIAWFLARIWKRALVIEAQSSLYDDTFLYEQSENTYRVWVGRFVAARAGRVMAPSVAVRNGVVSRLPALADRVDVVVRGYDAVPPASHTVSNVLHGKYPHCTFFMMVTVPPTDPDSASFAIEAAAFTLRKYKTFALVIVGNDSKCPALQKLAVEKGVEAQVFFEPFLSDNSVYMREAHIVLVPYRHSCSEQTLIAAALLKVPVIVSVSAALEQVHVPGESALVCAHRDMGCTIQAIATYVGDSVLRQRYANESARRTEQSEETRLAAGQAMRKSLQEAVFAYYATEDSKLSTT
jgi:hypothetical protein